MIGGSTLAKDRGPILALVACCLDMPCMPLCGVRLVRFWPLTVPHGVAVRSTLANVVGLASLDPAEAMQDDGLQY